MAAIKGIVDAVILPADIYAFQALADGVATADQQKRAVNWLLTEACRVLSDTYAEVRSAEGGPDDLPFALGRKHVGILIRHMNLPATLERAQALDKKLHPTSYPSQPQVSALRRNKRQPK